MLSRDKVWIEDDEETLIEKLSKNNKVEELKRTRIVHDKPMFFNDLARPHFGSKDFAWTLRALSAF